MHPKVDRVSQTLRRLGANGVPIELTEPAPTADLAAAQLGCEVGAIANSLIFDADGSPLLILTSGAHRVDTARVAEINGYGRLKRANPEFVRLHTGFAIGGVPPVGHPRPLPTLVDLWLKGQKVVWAAAGHANWVFPTSYDELVRITEGTPTEV
jgi:prolyl-tRNA editing enzyme YbaK/EbsC (Cys-tRNA(Pro) deacylase)